MPQPDWYLHLSGETLGPLTTETLRLMLDQYRLRLVDFAWREGMTEWKRVQDFDEFRSLLPAYPEAVLPDGKAPASSEAPDGSRVRVRRAERVQIQATVSIGGLGDFEVTDISESGLGIRGKVPLNIGTDITLRLLSPELGAILQLTGAVVQHPASATYGFGVKFKSLTPAHLGVLRTFVQSKAKS